MRRWLWARLAAVTAAVQAWAQAHLARAAASEQRPAGLRTVGRRPDRASRRRGWRR